MERALAEEGPPPTRGVHVIGERELRFQRRVTVILTAGPLIGVFLAIALLWGSGISALDFSLFLGLYVLTGFGITVGYHRLFTHRSFEAPAPVRALFAIAGSLAVQGAIIDWVATHRRHHAYADAYGDPHSPHLVEQAGLRGALRGLWHAHVGWFMNPVRTDTSRWAPDLEDDPVIARINGWFGRLVVISFALPALIGFVLTGTLWGAATALVWGALVRIFLLHHVTWSINSICHFFGTQPFTARDESRNTWPLSVISFGEAWHNNHHAFPTSARHGLLRGQFDPSWRLVWALQWMRLVRNVRLPSERAIARKWAGATKRLARW